MDVSRKYLLGMIVDGACSLSEKGRGVAKRAGSPGTPHFPIENSMDRLVALMLNEKASLSIFARQIIKSIRAD